MAEGMAEIEDRAQPVLALVLSDDFGLAAYEPAQLDQLFALVRTLRLEAGDFRTTEPIALAPNPSAPGNAGAISSIVTGWSSTGSSMAR